MHDHATRATDRPNVSQLIWRFKRIHPLSLVHKTVLLLFRDGRRCIALLVQESLANHVRNRAHPGSSPIAVWLLRLDMAEVGRVVVVGAALRAGRRLTGLAARLGAGRRHGAASLAVRCHCCAASSSKTTRCNCLNTCGYDDDDDDGKTTSGSSSGGSSGSGSSSGSSGSGSSSSSSSSSSKY